MPRREAETRHRGTLDASVSYPLTVLVVALVAFLFCEGRRTTPRGAPSNNGDRLVAALRSDLLTKMKHDIAAVDRIANGLHRKYPEEAFVFSYKQAIQDWLTDNNRIQHDADP